MRSLVEIALLKRADEQMESYDWDNDPESQVVKLTGGHCARCGTPLASYNRTGYCTSCVPRRVFQAPTQLRFTWRV